MKKRKILLGISLLFTAVLTACNVSFQNSGSSNKSNAPSSPSITSKVSSSEESKSESSSSTSSKTSSSVSSSAFSSSNKTSSSSSSSKSSSASSSKSSSSSSSSSSSVASSSSSSAQQSSSSTHSSSSSQPAKTTASFTVYAFNDTHGNVTDTSGKGLGIAKTTTALKSLSKDKNSIFISQGDMWQGSVESNYTRGNLVTEWMNSMNFVSMTVGNHEYDWGSDAIRNNVALADFPFLGINVVNKSNNQRVDYLQPSTTFERDGAKIGVIGAIGDCYSSISSSFVQDITFLTGSSLTALVKNESNRLRNEEHCDFIIYSIHGSFLEAGEYEEVLSNDHYVDLVLEGHTHQKYMEYDNAGILHAQCRGSNQDVIEINIDLNLVNKTYSYTSVNAIDFTYSYSPYKNAQEDAGVKALFDKYYDRYSIAYKELGVVSERKDQNTLRSKIADLYYEKGYEKWHSNYNITLGGGYMSCRASGIGPGMVTYSDLNDCFPFDNEIVLCSISGTNFKKTQFITGSQYYFVTWADPSVQYSVNTSTTYYLVTDTYTSDFYSNYVTVVDYLSIGTYARDLLAEYILEGHWTDAPATVHAGTLDDPKTIEEAREQGLQHTSQGESQPFYFTGVVSQIADYLGSSSGDMHNVYVKDADKNNAMMIYYLKKFQGANNYNGNWDSVNDLSVGDVLVFYGTPFYYNGKILEFASGTYCVSINGIPTA